MTGTIVRKMDDKKFGFIKPDDGSKDIFFHESGIVGGGFDSVMVGDKVSFEVEQSEKGPRAAQIKKI